MISTPITRQAINREWYKILTMARNNGFPEHIIHELKKKLITNKTKISQTKQKSHKQAHLKNKVINGPPPISTALLYTKLPTCFARKAWRQRFATNTVFQQLKQIPKNDNHSGIYQLKCNSCNKAYVGQSGRPHFKT